jgi:hypothetical protein
MRYVPKIQRVLVWDIAVAAKDTVLARDTVEATAPVIPCVQHIVPVTGTCSVTAILFAIGIQFLEMDFKML